ncbi:TraB/GumN family protein [Vibrio ziniensis]|uniref:TraB/GumN family protein n=1 Tax=Vibrio ziniensis TaxID=2711221 RepID=A0A6G7CK88_9VIBR|nr:TraB/GumN family protein [Vibrio ziniensis]QIH42490.1 TraB/GumN family protein [Vibrio ziniensis]
MSVITHTLRWLLPLVVFSVHAEPLYWSATNGKISLTIIGSVHVGEPSMFPLPNNIYQTLAKSDGLIVESDTTIQQKIVYPPTTKQAAQVLSQEQLFNLDQITTKFGLNAQQIHQLPPWSAALSLQFLQLQKLGYKTKDGVDLHLMQKAAEANIPLVPLETMQFQIDLLTHQPDDGKELLISIIDDWESNEDMTHCMIESWKAGDKINLEKMMHLTEMSPEMEQAFVTNRNQDWANKLSSGKFLPTQQGQYVMIVGALHLIGKQNFIEMLEKKGFKVSQQNRSKKANCEFF